MAANGTTDLPSSRSVEGTIDRLEELLRSNGIKIFARIDQAAAASEVGLPMRPPNSSFSVIHVPGRR